VSDPSTKNAYISVDGPEGLRPWVESVDKNTDKNDIINEKINKIKRVLNS
jgi:hypothetical protein